MYKAKLQYIMFENRFSSRKLGREESGWIFSTERALITAKFKQTTHICAETKFCAEDLSSGLWLSIFGPVIRKAPDTFEMSGIIAHWQRHIWEGLPQHQRCEKVESRMSIYADTFWFWNPPESESTDDRHWILQNMRVTWWDVLLKVGHSRPCTGMLCVASFGCVSRELLREVWTARWRNWM